MTQIYIVAAVTMAVTAGPSTVSDGITLRVTDEPLDNVFRRLMAQAGYNFIYEPSVMAGRRVTVDLSDASLDRALHALFDGTGITWTVQGRNVMLHTRADNSSGRVEARPTVVSGFVREAASGEALIGAVVGDPALHISAVTNSTGHYALEIPEGKTAHLTVRYPGMEQVDAEVVPTGRSRRLDFDLRSTMVLDEVSVVADAPGGSSVESASIGHINLSAASIATTPVMFGEPDVIKSLQLQPGVSAGMEGLAGMYVHGGEHDQNLVMLDNVPLYQVSHLGGLFSAINTRAVKNVDFYKSSFPARYNGRLSSVVEINTKDGSLTSHHGSATLGMTSGQVDVNGPIVRGRTSYSVAVRRTWLDVLTTPAIAIVNHYNKDLDKTIFGYNFTDLNAKINHRFNDRSHMYVSLYWGEDRLKGGYKEDYGSVTSDMSYDSYEQVAHLRWGNLVTAAGWTWQPSERLYTTLTGAFSRYSSRLGNQSRQIAGGSEIESDRRSESSDRNNISDWSLRAEAEWSASRSHHIDFGATCTLHRFTPRDKSSLLVNNGVTESETSVRDIVRASELSAYVSDDWRISDALRADYGVSVSLFSAGGRTHTGIDPRLALRWMMNGSLSVKGSYARMSQYVHQLTTSTLSLPTDQWVPVDGTMKPERSDHVALGVSARLPWWGLTLNAEGYYKLMNHLIDLRDDYYLIPSGAPWYERLCEGRGRARGFDLALERRTGAVTGHLSYSLLWADRQFADRNGGRRYPARYDNRHKINILVDWRINDRWSVSAAWTGMSGNRITLSTQDYEIVNAPDMPGVGDPVWDGYLDLQGERNGYRLPFYHRLDLSAVRRTRRGYWTFSIFNAYCQMNTMTVRKDHSYWSDWVTEYPTYRRVKLLPILPSVSYTWIF